MPSREEAIARAEAVQAEFGSIHGRIVSHWQREDDRFRLRVDIPTITTATIHLPARRASTVHESGRPLADAEGRGVRILDLFYIKR